MPSGEAIVGQWWSGGRAIAYRARESLKQILDLIGNVEPLLCKAFKKHVEYSLNAYVAVI
jgi:hypothetical protein